MEMMGIDGVLMVMHLQSSLRSLRSGSIAELWKPNGTGSRAFLQWTWVSRCDLRVFSWEIGPARTLSTELLKHAIETSENSREELMTFCISVDGRCTASIEVESTAHFWTMYRTLFAIIMRAPFKVRTFATTSAAYSPRLVIRSDGDYQ